MRSAQGTVINGCMGLFLKTRLKKPSILIEVVGSTQIETSRCFSFCLNGMQCGTGETGEQRTV